ncbi:retrovirus-related pol polyprotein from transposon TNT 1-94 [Tanacetum coccineum]
MKVCGCLAKIQIPLLKRTKLRPKTVDCVYLGPTKNSVAYRFLVYKSNIENISNNIIIESAKADFFENIFPYKDKEKQISNPRKRVMNDQLSQDETDNNSEIPQENVEPRRSKRAKVTKDFGPDYMTYIVNEEPQTYKAAMESSEAPYWKEAIQSEIDSIVHNNTWKLVDLPSGHKPIGHKWIFKKKLRPDGTIEKYKARLVAKGYRQKEGQDFFDTYSPVTRITSIRTLIAIAAIHNLIIHQMDVKTVFLNGELDKEIYMQQPEGFVVKGQEHKVCNWLNLFRALNKLQSNGMKNDMLILITNMDVINQTKKMLHSSFDMKDIGEADVILDLAYSVSRLSQYSHNPGRDHWDALVRVLQYLKHTMAYGLHYTKYPLVSTMEAEFVALDKAAEKAEWLRSFLKGIPLWPKHVTTVCIHCDSMVALCRAKNHIYNGKSRHIRRRHNTIKNLLRNGIISIDYIKSKENIVDPLTKGLCREQVIFTSRGMGLKPTQ